ncbi:MAG: response regulator, partial [Desulfobacterota bacterium]|nr:response regulator [Thermodesulfobacteriota bacterium]
SFLALPLLFLPSVMKKVLILEQEKTIRQSLLHIMERYSGFEVFAASSFKEGFSLFKALPFDIVLCGHRLPDGDGLEILREWMKQRPQLISVLMTASNDERLKVEAKKAGIRGYLEKPFDLRQLEEAIGSSEMALPFSNGVLSC